VVYTEINDKLAYYVAFISPTSKYQDYLPAAENMIKSFRINNIEIQLVNICRAIKANPGILDSLSGLGPAGAGVDFGGHVSALFC
jgi:hypothetical protein